MDQDDRGDHGRSLLGWRAARCVSRSPRGCQVASSDAAIRTAGRSATATGRARSRPARPGRGAAGGLGPRRLGVHQPGAAGGEPAVQQPHLLGGRAAQRPGPGQHHLGAEPQRVDHRHRRAPRARATPAAASRPCRTTAISQPPVPSGRAPTTSGTRRQRGQPLARLQRDDEAGQPVATAGRGLEPLPPAQRGDRRLPAAGSGCVVAAGDQVAASRGDGRGVLRRASGARRTARRSGRSSCSAHGLPRRPRGPGCAACTAAAARRRARSRPRRRAACRDRNGPSAPSRGVVTTDSRGNASAVGATHHARCGAARAPVVARLVRRDQPQLAHRGLQRVRAHDGVDPLGLRHHVAHPPAALARGEVAAHPPAQVAARADVEHLVAGAAEQVHPGRGRHGVGERAACAAAPWWAGAGPTRGPARAAPRGSARRGCRPARAAGAAPRRWRARRPAPGGWGRWRCRRAAASAPSRTLGASSRASTARASRAVHSTGGRGHACPWRSQAALQEPGVERGVVRHQHRHRRRNSSTDGSTAGSRGAPVIIAVVMPVSATMFGGSPVPGSTSVASSPICSPPRTLTAPISVIASVRAEPPVVSRSSTTNVTSRSGVPSSSNDSCAGRCGEICTGRAPGSTDRRGRYVDPRQNRRAAGRSGRRG